MLKFCVDPELIESAIALDYISSFSGYEDLTDQDLRDCFESKTEGSRVSLNLDTLNIIAKTDLRMNMSSKNCS